MTERQKRLQYYNQYWEQGITEYGDGTGDRQRVRYWLVAQAMTKTGGDILDVGCGDGQGSLSLQSPGFVVTGTDLSEVGVAKARRKRLKAFVKDVETEEIPGVYDVVICMEVLEHVQFPLAVLTKLKDNLAADGEMFISLPNEFHLLRRLQILLGRQDFSRYDFPHLRFFDRQEAHRLISDAGYRVEQELRVPLPPPRMQFLTKVFKWLSSLSPELFTIGFVFRIIPEERI